MEEVKNIDIVIVNWNSGNQLMRCLDSIVRHGDGIVSKVIVVDNNSSDGSADDLNGFSLPLTVIHNRQNEGFASACNQGAREGDAPYLLFLNPDTELFVNSLSGPLVFMEEDTHVNIGICGIQLVDDHGLVSRSCARFPSMKRFLVQAVGLDKMPGLKDAGVPMAAWDHLSSKFVNHVIGAFFLVRRTLFKTLHGFDERFFVYLEDVDFSFRAYQAGWKTYYLADSQAFHKGGGTSDKIKATRLFYSLRSRMQYGFKHFHPIQAWLLFSVMISAEPVCRTVFSFCRGGIQGVRDTWRAYHLWYLNITNP